MNLESRLERLDDIAQLKAGWLDGRGEAVDPDLVGVVRDLLPAFYSTFNPRTGIYLYPTEQGGISLEWEDDKGRHGIEVL